MSEIKKILIVDDEPDIAKTLSQHLEKKGYEIKVAGNGEECLAIVKDFMPDIILLDILMPVMDGISTLRKLKADTATLSIPVILLTNLDSQDKVAEAMEIGTTHYLIKSDYSSDDLDKKIEEVLSFEE